MVSSLFQAPTNLNLGALDLGVEPVVRGEGNRQEGSGDDTGYGGEGQRHRGAGHLAAIREYLSFLLFLPLVPYLLRDMSSRPRARLPLASPHTRPRRVTTGYVLLLLASA